MPPAPALLPVLTQPPIVIVLPTCNKALPCQNTVSNTQHLRPWTLQVQLFQNAYDGGPRLWLMHAQCHLHPLFSDTSTVW